MKKTLCLVAAVMGLFACKNQEVPEQTPVEEPQVTTQQNNGAAYFANPVAWNGTFIEIGSAMTKTASSAQHAPMRTNEDPSYPLYFIDPQDGTWPVTVTVSYGEEGVMGVDGLEHSGIMRISATNLFEQPGSVVTPAFENFQVYGTLLTGTQKIENLGKNLNDHLVYDVTVSNGVFGSGSEFVYSEHTMRELVSGLGANDLLLPDVTTHQYSITGWMKGVSSIDTIPGYEITIDESAPMVIAVGDLYPTAGHVVITFDKPIVYNFSEEEMTKGIPVASISVDECEMSFLGRVSDGVYRAKVLVPVNNVSFSTITVSIQFNMDARGIVMESVTFGVEGLEG